jgi:ribosomal protein S18 acetylase RimI-like enzyme
MEQDKPSVRIRMAVSEDATSIATVLHESFIEYRPLYTQQGFAATTPISDQVLNRIEEGPVWVVFTDNDLVGTVSALPKGDSLYIRGLAVVPAARGRRIGDLLLQQVEEFAAEQGYKRLFLSTTPFLAQAIKLYERQGFKRSGEGPDHLFGTPLFTMEKLLNRTIEN